MQFCGGQCCGHNSQDPVGFFLSQGQQVEVLDPPLLMILMIVKKRASDTRAMYSFVFIVINVHLPPMIIQVASKTYPSLPKYAKLFLMIIVNTKTLLDLSVNVFC